MKLQIDDYIEKKQKIPTASVDKFRVDAMLALHDFINHKMSQRVDRSDFISFNIEPVNKEINTLGVTPPSIVQNTKV